MSPEWRVKSDGRYYRGIRANPDLCDGPATKYVGYFRREKHPGQSIANTRRSLRLRSHAELHSDHFACRRNAALDVSAYCTVRCQTYIRHLRRLESSGNDSVDLFRVNSPELASNYTPSQNITRHPHRMLISYYFLSSISRVEKKFKLECKKILIKS